MGSSGKGGSSPQYTSQDAYNHGYSLKEGNVRMEGLAGWTPDMEGYDQVYAGYMQAHNEKVQKEKFKMMMEQGNADSVRAYEASMAAQRAAAEEARLSGLRDKRDSMIGGYFDAANSATSYVSEKLASEKSNAAMMGVDYNMSDDIKNERISNYFGSIWSEGNQAELEGSFNEVGAGDFEQTLWRGEGVEAGPAGSVGEEQAGGGIKAKAKKTLIDDENTLGVQSILGAA